MSRKLLIASAALVVALLLLLAVPTGVAISQELMDVFVTNFPDVQRVEGKVAVEGPIRNATLVSVREVIVSPVQPGDTQRWIEAGTLTTDGYPYMVLSLVGQVKGSVTRPGVVGVVLIPDQEPILRAFNEEGQVQFPLEVNAPSVSGRSPYFASSSVRHTVAFPSYKIFLYNSSDKTVSVHLYAYLTGD